MRALVGVRHPARQLARVHVRPAHEAEHRHPRVLPAGHAVAGLRLATAEVDRAAVQARRRAGLQAPLRQLELLQAHRQADGRRVARAAGLVVVQPDVDAPVQEGAGRQHHRPRPEGNAHLRDGAHHAVALQQQVVDGLLEQHQIGLVLQPAADGGLVQHAVGLRARSAHGGALAAVENAELDARLIGGQRHRAAQRVDLAHQVTLADAADAGVAAHLPQRLDVVRQQQRARAHAGGRQRRLGAGVAATDDDDIKGFGVNIGRHGRSSSSARPSRRGQSAYFMSKSTFAVVRCPQAAIVLIVPISRFCPRRDPRQ